MEMIRLLFLFTLLLVGLQCTEAQNISFSSFPSPPPPPPPYYSVNAFSPLTAGIIGGMVLFFFLAGTFCFALRRCLRDDLDVDGANGAAAGEVGNARRCGLDAAVLDTYPTMAYEKVKELKIGDNALECAVCLAEFSDDDVLRLLPGCNHVFHVKCIDAWLESHATCPVCRSVLSLQLAGGAAQQAADSTTAWEADRGPEAGRDLEAARALTPVVIHRWNSTGHEAGDRYTLRLPGNVQIAILATPTHPRASSVTAVHESGDAIGRRNNQAVAGALRSSRWLSLLRSFSLNRSRKQGEASSSDAAPAEQV